MTVKDVFDLRRQGRIEEAYEAIRPMYAVHKGRYTTLCMFWTAADVFKLRLDQDRTEEAGKILEALRRMLPRVEEITKQLDSERPTVNTVDKPAENKKPLPWEKGTAKTADEQDKAAAFIAAATRRLEKVRKQEEKKEKRFSKDFERNDHNKATSAAANLSSSCQSTDTGHTSKSESLRGDTTLDNPSHLSSNEDINVTYTPTGEIITRDDLNPGQRIVLACLSAHPGYSVTQISASTGIPVESIENHMLTLIGKNLVEYRGNKKTGGYYPL